MIRQMSYRSLCILIFLFAALHGKAQNGIREVRAEIELFNYSKAIVLLQKEVSKGGPKSQREAMFLLADCYRMLNNAEVAKTWYGKGISINGLKPPADPDTWFHFGQSLRTCGEYMHAKEIFLHLDSLAPSDGRGRHFAALCDSALAWQLMKPQYMIGNIRPINSPQSEFGPAFFRNGIIFASDRTPGYGSNKTYGWTGNSYLNLYFAEQQDTLPAAFLPPRPFPWMADHGWHVGPVCFSRDYKTAFFTQTQVEGDKGKKESRHLRTHLLKIFSSSLENGKWSVPQPFFLNSDDYSVGHPALSPDGQTLFFVSDMPGGSGETDIYSCSSTAGGWSSPVNLGSVVNSPGKEMFPFVAPNGELWFASDGLPGFGGLDLFVTRKVDGHWGRPEHPGQPMNSSYDDFSPAVAANGKTGLFSSNRPGGMGDDDLYYFAVVGSEPRKTEPPAVAEAKQVMVPPVMNPDTMVTGQPYRLENIFYDFDKWNIREDAKPPLNRLVALLKKYPVSIELGSHTDCRGSAVYNQVLSQKRAESAVLYIISMGIPAERITAKGYGKSRLANQCDCSAGSECTEEEHQYNRRTEFMITGKK